MSIASEITRISGNIADAYTSLNAKGATMPATQNSANLADTIDTITTGGGSTQEIRGSWVVPQEVLDLEDAFDEWQQNFTANQTYLYGFLFHKGIETVLLQTVNKNTGDDSIVTSSGSVTWESSTKALVTFDSANDYNWVVFECSYPIGAYDIIFPYRKVAADGIDLAGTVKYIIIKNNTSSNTTLSISPFSSSISGYPVLESIKSVNVKFGSAFTSNEMQGASRRYMPPISNWGSATPDSSVISYFSSYAHLLPNLPYGLDFSSSTTNLTLGSTTCSMNNIREAYIKLPNANFTIKQNSGISFSRENWEYIANNAPTVSGKTLTMGMINIAICGGTDGTIIQTLTNKGWTVA